MQHQGNGNPTAPPYYYRQPHIPAASGWSYLPMASGSSFPTVSSGPSLNMAHGLSAAMASGPPSGAASGSSSAAASGPTTPIQPVMMIPLTMPPFPKPAPQVLPPVEDHNNFMPTNYHRRKCTGPDNMGTQCLPRQHSEGVWECMYCGVLLMLYYPGQEAHLLPWPYSQ